VNDAVLYGHNHVEVVSVLRDSPRRVRIVCARPRDTLNSLRSIAAANPAVAHSLFKAKSEQVLVSSPPVIAHEVGIVGRSHSLEPLVGLATWGSDVVAVELYKGDRGLGFSILDYQVEHKSLLFSLIIIFLFFFVPSVYFCAIINIGCRIVCACVCVCVCVKPKFMWKKSTNGGDGGSCIS